MQNRDMAITTILNLPQDGGSYRLIESLEDSTVVLNFELWSSDHEKLNDGNKAYLYFVGDVTNPVFFSSYDRIPSDVRSVLERHKLDYLVNNTITFNLFKSYTETLEDEYIRLGEIPEPTRCQELVKDGGVYVLAFDHHAEAFAKVLPDAGVIAIADEEGNLHFVEIRDGAVIYKAKSPLEGVKLEFMPMPKKEFLGSDEDGNRVELEIQHPEMVLVHVENNTESPFVFGEDPNPENGARQFAKFLVKTLPARNSLAFGNDQALKFIEEQL